jgi:GT2 family glycosyltransferase
MAEGADGAMIDATVVISTFNRADALPPTLAALGRQDISPDHYEVVVVNDGSKDRTRQTLESIQTPYRLRTIHFDENRGVSAGRNAGMQAAEGRLLILLSDDMIVSENFVSAHLRLHARFPDAWIVGGFSQLEDLTATPFGRYLDRLERRFDAARLANAVDDHVWEMTWPTARNLSLPRSDLERAGLFDEQFRVTCEDQDWAQRAGAVGIRYLYSDEINCIHNDGAADLSRYCRFQERGAMDTVRLVRKHPAIHGGAPIVAVNGPIRRGDPLALSGEKALKSVLARRPTTALIERAVSLLERVRAPDRLLFRLYGILISLATFRGWREGLRQEAAHG